MWACPASLRRMIENGRSFPFTSFSRLLSHLHWWVPHPLLCFSIHQNIRETLRCVVVPRHVRRTLPLGRCGAFYRVSFFVLRGVSVRNVNAASVMIALCDTQHGMKRAGNSCKTVWRRCTPNATTCDKKWQHSEMCKPNSSQQRQSRKDKTPN